MNIQINFIPAVYHRYPTAGDWYYEGEDLIIAVSSDDPEFPTEDGQFLVALHELVEAWLCRKHGVTQEQVDVFDLSSTAEEPGNEPTAPYRAEHRQAMLIEYMMANFLGLPAYGVMQ